MPLENHQDPSYVVTPQFWIEKSEVEKTVGNKWAKNWLLAYRKTSSAKLERTFVATILPRVGVSDKAPLIFIEDEYILMTSFLLANLNSICWDYIARQKIGGTDISYFHIDQLPILPPSAYTPADIDFITPRVLELVYTANDLRPFAEDMGYYGEPFRWDEVRRAQLRAELDAYYARLYGLTRDELRYILDPKEVHGEDFPGETFRVLKEKEVKQFGEYRTRRLVLEAWDKLIM